MQEPEIRRNRSTDGSETHGASPTLPRMLAAGYTNTINPTKHHINHDENRMEAEMDRNIPGSGRMESQVGTRRLRQNNRQTTNPQDSPNPQHPAQKQPQRNRPGRPQSLVNLHMFIPTGSTNNPQPPHQMQRMRGHPMAERTNLPNLRHLWGAQNRTKYATPPRHFPPPMAMPPVPRQSRSDQPGR